MRCEHGLIGLIEEGRGLRQYSWIRGRGPGGPGDVVLNRPIIDAMLARREAVILGDGQKRSAMGAPLLLHGRVVGFLYVGERGAADRFASEDLHFLTALAQVTAAALRSVERYQRATLLVDSLSAREPQRVLLGESAAIAQLRGDIQKYARASDSPVMIHGESGSGKELVAHQLHVASERCDRPFLAVNCAAIPDTMIESVLFGHDKGAFTGASKDQRGKFSLAHSGTLFLDEIGDLSLSAQAKVLRAVEEGEIQPLGSERTIRVNVRIISATHKELSREVAEKRFREDLFYRLNVIELTVPPLRARREDIALLANTFLQHHCQRTSRRIKGFSAAALEILASYRWPGNVRELRNEVERAVIHCESTIIEASDLSPRLRAPDSVAPSGSRSLADQFSDLDGTERRLIVEAMTKSHGNVAEAARLLGISRSMMKRRLERFDLSKDSGNE
jgi:Nif-specific regulatory protein